MSGALPLAALSPALAQRIGQILADSRVPGAAIALVHRGQHYLYTHGIRGADTPAPVTAHTAFDLGSCSKSYVATAIALLVGEGRLDFDDPVQRHLPELELDQPSLTAQLSIRDLLCNRIGLKRQIPLESFANPELSALDVLRRVKYLDRLHPFRAGYVYFNPGFMACRLIVERLSGLPYGQFLRQRLFEPLGMKHSASGTERVNRLPDRACGHALWQQRVTEIHEDLFDNWQGAAGVHSCAADALRWLEFQLADGAGLLPAAVLQETRRPHTLIPAGERKLIHAPPEAAQAHYCLGWWTTTLQGRTLVQHAGEMFGWRAQHALLPQEGIGVSVMLSLGVPRHAALAYTVLESLLGGDSRDWVVVADRMLAQQVEQTRGLLAAAFPVGTEPPLPLQSYAGDYEHAACGRVEVRVAGEGLALRFRDGRLWDLQLRHLGAHVFESRPRRPAVCDYFPEPLRLRFEVHDSTVIALEDLQARYRRRPIT